MRIRYDIVLNAVFLITAAAVCTAWADERNAIGGFDINKVREFAGGSRDSSFSATSVTPTQKSETVARGYTFIVLRVIGSLAIIIALIALASWLIRKTGLAGASRIGRSGSMEILEALSLGQNRAVVLLRVMDTVYLCGQTASTIALLDKLEGQRALDLVASSKGPSSVVQFKDAFNQFISKVKK